MGNRIRVRLACLFVLLLTVVGTLPVWGQTTTAALRGTVTDPAGAVIPGLTITVRNVDTGRDYTVETDESGLYYVPGLPPGSYTLTAEKEGFHRLIREGIVLTVNQVGQVDLSLTLGALAQEVVVRESVALVETEGATISGVVAEKQIKELPLNARDFYQLALLEPGVASIAANANPSPWQNTTNGKLAANGMRPSMNTTVLDGAEVSDPGHNQPLGGPSGSAFGVDSTREFRVLTNMYTAEFGRNGGAVVQVVTKSGSNTFHGSVYEFLRNDVLDASNFFDDPNAPIPELRRNQFGFTLGGPIVKDRTFFFFNYEGFRERKGETRSFVTPTAAARGGAAPEIQPYLDFYPLPNDPSALDLGDGTGVHNTSRVRETDENYLIVRIDHQLASRDSLSVRYLFDEGDSLKPFMSTVVPGFDGVVDTRNQFLVITEQHTFSPVFLNEFSASINRLNYIQEPARVNAGLSLALSPEEKPIGEIDVGGLPSLGHALTIPVGQQANVFHFLDHVTYNAGRHVLKGGVDIRRFHINGPFDLFGNGFYIFGSLPDFVAGNVAFFLGTSATSPDSNRGYRQTNFTAFVQDEFRATSNLTVNMGLRYEFNSSPSEHRGRNANIRDPLTDTTTTVGKLYDAPTALFAPRLGVAWSPFGDRKTVLRAGIGVFYDLIKQDIYGDTRWLPPFYDILGGGFGPGSFRNLTVLFPAGTNVPIVFDLDNPYALSFNVQIQRELTPETLFTIGYVGSRGNHLTRSGEVNPPQFSPVTGFIGGAPTNPNFGSILQIVTDAQSFYNSLQLGVKRRFSQGFSFQASYTLSKSIDDSSGPFLSDFQSEPNVVQDLTNRKGNRGLSGFDNRHNFVSNFLYELPFGPGKAFGNDLTGAAAQIAEGWQIGGIITLNSAFPFTVRHADNRAGNGLAFAGGAIRPDIIPGGKCEATGDPAQWFDPSIFVAQPAGFFGNSGRNICPGPDFKNLDFSIMKNTRIGERVNVQFRAEFFNITNHPNFGPPVNTPDPNGAGGTGDAVFAGGAPLASAGRIFRTVNESRQIQFGLKIIF